MNEIRNQPGSPGEGDDSQDWVPEDDRVIGLAVKWSLLVVLLIASVVAAIWLWRDSEVQTEVIDEAPQAVAQSLPQDAFPQAPEIRFVDITDAAGIEFRHHSGAYGERLLPETMGSGVAVFDFDNDGDQDLYFANSQDWPWRDQRETPAGALYANDGAGNFDNVTPSSGLEGSFYGTGVAAADYDGDGRVDLFVAAVGRNHLFRNLGDGRFEEVTETAGVAGDDQAWSSSAAFFDADGDQDLDLFVANYVVWSRQIDMDVDYRLDGVGRAYGPPMNYAGTHGYLYRNDGDGRFSDVSASSGVQVTNPATGAAAGKGLAVRPLDFDQDGDLDLIVANDTVQNFLFVNDGQGQFEEQGALAGLAFDPTGRATGAMGVDAGPINEGDDLAVAIGNFANEMTSYYVAQSGSALFSDEAIVSGVGPESRQALSFGLLFLDVDLDGGLDLFQTNGHVENDIAVVQPSQRYEQPSQLFWHCGIDCPRTYQRVAAGDLDQPVVGRGAAYGDFDGDGDLDLVITQVDRKPLMLRNDTVADQAWLRVSLQQSGPNTQAVGAKVVVHQGDETLRRVVMPARSYLSSVEPVLTFGLKGNDEAVKIEVIWPDGESTQHPVNGLNQHLTLSRG